MSNPQDPLRPNDVDPDAMFAALDGVGAETPIGIPQRALETCTAEVTPTEPVDILFPAREDEPETTAITPPRPEPTVEVARPAPPSVVEQSRDPQSEPIVLPRDERPWSAWQERRREVQPEATPEPVARARTFSPAAAIAPELPPPVAELAPHAAPQGLFATVAEDIAEEPSTAEPSAASLRMIWAAVAALAVIVIVEGIYIATSRGTAASAGTMAAPSNVGTVHVQSTPPGATVLLNGQDRGATPATLLLAAGDYQLEIVRGAQRQPLPVKVKAGAESVYQVVLAGGPEMGGMRVSSEPAGVPVAIDGTRRGITPLTVSELAAGEHTVTVFGPSGSIENKVAVAAGGVASMAVTLPAAAKSVGTGGTMAVGYVSVEAPVEMQLLENGKLVGTSRMDRIILPAGQHEIEAVNEPLGYSATQRVTVTADKATRVQFEVPTSKVSVNAIPWADVEIDGKSVGQTPIGNLSVAIGSHEIVYRHPQLGEQRQTVTVTVAGPNRFSAAMKR